MSLVKLDLNVNLMAYTINYSTENIVKMPQVFLKKQKKKIKKKIERKKVKIEPCAQRIDLQKLARGFRSLSYRFG